MNAKLTGSKYLFIFFCLFVCFNKSKEKVWGVSFAGS